MHRHQIDYNDVVSLSIDHIQYMPSQNTALFIQPHPAAMKTAEEYSMVYV